jgi:arylsulfatase A-like enzyme
LMTALRELRLEDTTDVFVTADHGFGTIVKGTITSGTSVAARCANPDRPPAGLPQGFLAVDIAKGLGLPLFDPDAAFRPLDCSTGETLSLGNGLVGSDPAKPDVVVAANGGSDLIYLPQGNARALAADVVRILLAEDYVSGIFVNDSLGEIAGTLPMSRINLIGGAVTPAPAIVVNFRSFRSFSDSCGDPLLCTQIIADTNLRQGQGNHGGFSRAETRNFMAAFGPDFKAGFVDDAPVSNADIAVTLARVLGISLPSKGALTGRALSESLKGGAPVKWERRTIASTPAASGQTTILNLQRVGTTVYFDAAGFEGRTVGLEMPATPQ